MYFIALFNVHWILLYRFCHFYGFEYKIQNRIFLLFWLPTLKTYKSQQWISGVGCKFSFNLASDDLMFFIDFCDSCFFSFAKCITIQYYMTLIRITISLFYSYRSHKINLMFDINQYFVFINLFQSWQLTVE